MFNIGNFKMSWFSKTVGSVWDGIKKGVKGVLGVDGKGVTVVIQPPVIVQTEEAIAREKGSIVPQLAGIDTNLILLIGLPVILYFMLRKK